jgi:hypothetical protein
MGQLCRPALREALAEGLQGVTKTGRASVGQEWLSIKVHKNYARLNYEKLFEQKN